MLGGLCLPSLPLFPYQEAALLLFERGQDGDHKWTPNCWAEVDQKACLSLLVGTVLCFQLSRMPFPTHDTKQWTRRRATSCCARSTAAVAAFLDAVGASAEARTPRATRRACAARGEDVGQGAQRLPEDAVRLCENMAPVPVALMAGAQTGVQDRSVSAHEGEMMCESAQSPLTNVTALIHHAQGQPDAPPPFAERLLLFDRYMRHPAAKPLPFLLPPPHCVPSHRPVVIRFGHIYSRSQRGPLHLIADLGSRRWERSGQGATREWRRQCYGGLAA